MMLFVNANFGSRFDALFAHWFSYNIKLALYVDWGSSSPNFWVAWQKTRANKPIGNVVHSLVIRPLRVNLKEVWSLLSAFCCVCACSQLCDELDTRSGDDTSRRKTNGKSRRRTSTCVSKSKSVNALTLNNFHLPTLVTSERKTCIVVD